MSKQPIQDPAGEVFAVLPGSSIPPSEPSGDWWIDLVEIDLDPPIEPTGDDELTRLDLMGDLRLMALNDDLFCRRGFGLGEVARPLFVLRAWLTRRRYNRRLLALGYPLIPRSFQPGARNGRF